MPNPTAIAPAATIFPGPTARHPAPPVTNAQLSATCLMAESLSSLVIAPLVSEQDRHLYITAGQ